MKNIPIRVWKSSGLVILIGSVILIFSHWKLKDGSIAEEIFRDVGIAFVVAGIISIAYEWSTRTTEKRIEMKSVLEESLSTFIPDVLWNEVKSEVLLRKVFRSNMEIKVTIFENDFVPEDSGKNILIPKGHAILKITLSYDLYGVSTGENLVPIKSYLDQHMRNDDIDIPRFTSFRIKGDDVDQTFSGAQLEKLINKMEGVLEFRNCNVPYMYAGTPTKITIDRYELINIPGTYYLVMPEMIVPFSKESDTVRKPTIEVSIENRSQIRENLGITLETWSNSSNHNFVKTSDSMWQFKGVMLPGQGFSFIFKTR